MAVTWHGSEGVSCCGGQCLQSRGALGWLDSSTRCERAVLALCLRCEAWVCGAGPMAVMVTAVRIAKWGVVCHVQWDPGVAPMAVKQQRAVQPKAERGYARRGVGPWSGSDGSLLLTKAVLVSGGRGYAS